MATCAPAQRPGRVGQGLSRPLESGVRRHKEGWVGLGWGVLRPWPFLPCAGKVLGNLQLNLLSKSKVYEDPALSAIFLHNNYNYILKSLEK